MADYKSAYTGAQIDSAIGKAHEHSNKEILDNTTASYTQEEKTKLANLHTEYPITELGETLVLIDGDNVQNLATGFYRTHNVTINGTANPYFSNSIIYVDRTISADYIRIEKVVRGAYVQNEPYRVYIQYSLTNGQYPTQQYNSINLAWDYIYNKPEITTQEIVTTFWQGTQSEYDALGTYNATTLYLIKEG